MNCIDATISREKNGIITKPDGTKWERTMCRIGSGLGDGVMWDLWCHEGWNIVAITPGRFDGDSASRRLWMHQGYTVFMERPVVEREPAVEAVSPAEPQMNRRGRGRK